VRQRAHRVARPVGDRVEFAWGFPAELDSGPDTPSDRVTDVPVGTRQNCRYARVVRCLPGAPDWGQIKASHWGQNCLTFPVEHIAVDLERSRCFVAGLHWVGGQTELGMRRARNACCSPEVGLSNRSMTTNRPSMDLELISDGDPRRVVLAGRDGALSVAATVRGLLVIVVVSVRKWGYP